MPGAGAFAGGAGTVITKTGGKGVLKALGLSNPWGWLAIGLDVGLGLLLRKVFKPKLEPLPVRSINVTGGREVARYVMGERRTKLEWTDATTLPGSQYRDNYKQFIACLSELACDSIQKIWVDQEDFPYRIDPSDATHYVPVAGSAYNLPAADVSKYGFPTPYAFEVWQRFKADGTQADLVRTDGNARWSVPANRQYNGNPGGNNWGPAPTERTTHYRDPLETCESGYELDYDNAGNPVCRRIDATDFSDTVPVTYDYANAPRFDYALEVKTIDANYKLNGIAWAAVRWFEPFYQQSDRSSKLYQRAPDVDVLMRGVKMTTPYSTEPVYSDNPVAILHWIDTVYRGIPADRIDAAAYKAAYDHCEETITYWYGAVVPDDGLGADGEYYARADGRIYTKISGAWHDLGPFQGDYAWLSSQGDGSRYDVKRYRCNIEIEVGADLEDVYEAVLATCGDGRRYEHQGRTHYRVGVKRPVKLNVPAGDIREVGEFQPWQPVKSRVNKMSARMAQSAENDWLPDDVEFTDTAAVQRDGETREAQYELEGESNPIRALNLLKIQLGLLRTAAVWPVVIGLMGNMEQRSIEPLDVLTLNNPEHGWNNTKCQVINVVHLPDRTAACLMREYDDTIYDPTLRLPGIPRRPVRIPTSDSVPELTGLRAADRLDIRHDSIRTITDITWNPVVAQGTKVQYQFLARLNLPPTAHVQITGALPIGQPITTAFAPSAHLQISGALPAGVGSNRGTAPSAHVKITPTLPIGAAGRSLFDAGVAVREAQGLLYRAKGLRPFSIGATGSGADYITTQTQRAGEWLNFQWGPLWNDGSIRGAKTETAARAQALQMQRRADDTLIPILGWTGPNGRNATIWRFGIYASGNTQFGVGEINANRTSLTQTRMDLTADQIRDWRIVMRDSTGETFLMDFPAASEDPSEPYLWDQGTALRTFLQAARSNGRTVDVAIVDSASALIDYPILVAKWFENAADSASILIRGALPSGQGGAVTYRGFWHSAITDPLDKGILYRQQNLQADGSGQTAVMVNGVDADARASGTADGFYGANAGGTNLGNAAVYFYKVAMDASGVFEFIMSGSASARTIVGARNTGSQVLIDANRRAGMTFCFFDAGTRAGITIGPGDITETTWTPDSADSARFTGTVSSTKAATLRTFADNHDSATTRFQFAVVDTGDSDVDLANFRVRE